MRTTIRTVLHLSLLVASLAAAAEVQVPLDRAGRVQRVDAALARRLGMFPDRPGFQEARLFLLPDSSFVLEISSMLPAGLTRERVPLTPAGVDSIREGVTAGLALQKTPLTIEKPGRPLFVATTSVMAFGFYGWVIPYLFEENASDQVKVGTYLVTAGAGTFIPLYFTRNRPVTMASAAMAWYGMSRGALHGALLPYALNVDPVGKPAAACALGFSVVEGIAGFEWAARTGMSTGSAATISNGTDFGALYGLGFSHLFNGEDSGRAAGTLIGSGVGLVASALYAPRRDHTYGDASVMRTGGWVGGFTGLAIVQTFGPENYEKSSTVGAVAGGTLGLLVGDRLVRKADFSFGQSIIVDLTTFGGGLLGLGTGFLAQGSGGSERVLWSTTAAGTVVGYAVGYSMYAKIARRAGADRSAWRFDVMPTPPTGSSGMPGVMLTMNAALR
jgi:hypothetical protein